MAQWPAFLALATSLMSLSELDCAAAASISSDGQGHTIVDAYKERMKFEESQSERVALSFMRSDCDPKPRQSVKDALANDEIVACVTQDESARRKPDGFPEPDMWAQLPVMAGPMNVIYAPATPGLPTTKLRDPVIVAKLVPGFSVMVRSGPGFRSCEAGADARDDILGYRRRETATNPPGLQYILAADRRGEGNAWPLVHNMQSTG